jgi:hypothetical protein
MFVERSDEPDMQFRDRMFSDGKFITLPRGIEWCATAEREIG